MPLFFSFKDANKNIIDTYKFIYSGHDHDGNGSDSPKRQGLGWDNAPYGSDVRNFNSIVSNWQGNYPNTLSEYRSDFIIVITDGVFDITAEIDMDVNQLSKISTVEVQVEAGR